MNNTETAAALRAEAVVHLAAARRLNQRADDVEQYGAQSSLYSSANSTAEITRIKSAAAADLSISSWDGTAA